MKNNLLITVCFLAAVTLLEGNAKPGPPTPRQQKKAYEKVMKNKKDPALYLDRIHDDELLFKITDTHPNVEIRRIALSRIEDQEFLGKLISSTPWFTENLYMEILERITDQEILESIARRLTLDMPIRLSAIERITDQDRLKVMVYDNYRLNSQLICAALKGITDQSFIYEYIISPEVAMWDGGVTARTTALNTLTDSEYLAELLDGYAFARDIAIRRIEDQQVLQRIALTGKDYIRPLAIPRIEDQDFLVQIAQTDSLLDIRRMAFENLDSVTLARLADGYDDNKALEVAARIVTGRSTWDEEFADRSTDHIGHVIGAVPLIPTYKPSPRNVVSACHAYIRQGDATRIPELTALLLEYGDKSLAEDYLNCGNDQLYEAARQWGRKNGYNIGTGYGSHRVRWGR